MTAAAPAGITAETQAAWVALCAALGQACSISPAATLLASSEGAVLMVARRDLLVVTLQREAAQPDVVVLVAGRVVAWHVAEPWEYIDDAPAEALLRTLHELR